MSFTRKFDDLPNEILLEFFKYLNALHLFHSLDNLNRRFSQLIRWTELHLNFAKVTESIYEAFCRKTREDPSIKGQVTSIALSDQRSFDESNRFFSDYRMEEFLHVQYLSLTHLKRENAKKFLSMLSSMPQVRYLYLDVIHGRHYSSYEKLFHPLVEISIEQLKQLNIAMLPKTIGNPRNTSWLLERLTIRKITFEQIRKICRYSPLLKQMQIGDLSSKYRYEVKYPIARRSCAMNLEKLTINCCDDFQTLEYLFHLTPNLKDFTFIMEEAEAMINGQRWEQLISSFLKNLVHFRFQLSLRRYYNDKIDGLTLKLKEFQSDFWEKEHPWPLRYEISCTSILIHSIPYLSNKYQLSPVLESYQSPSINSKITFDRVTELSNDYSMIDSSTSFFFPNVQYLRLDNDSILAPEQKTHWLSLTHISQLNELLCLPNIKELFLHPEYELESPSVIIQLLKAATNLSTLRIDLELIRVLSSTDEQFSLLIREKIKSLITREAGHCQINENVLFDNSYSVDQFCERYPHLERLRAQISHPSHC